jgi:prepilin-type N-terminal cleavage/methylation domain-containing protein
MKKNKKNKGFTLFELLVSISIIGILTALASVAFSGAQKKARDARRVQDVKLIQTAAEQYYSQNSYAYPTSSSSYEPGQSWTIGTQQPILESYPSDPKEGATYSYDCSPAGSCTTAGYCVCVSVENMANANSGANCLFSAAPANKLYFCVKNQQ